MPQEASVVRLHDTWFAEHVNRPLSVVQLPLAEVGAPAVELLIPKIPGPTDEETVLRASVPRLVVRGTAARNGEGLEVTAAIAPLRPKLSDKKSRQDW